MMNYADSFSRFPLRIAVAHAIVSLPERSRELAEMLIEKLRAGETICVYEISNELNRPYATVYGQLHKALEQIGECLENEPIIQEWQSEHALDTRMSDQNLVRRLLTVCRMSSISAKSETKAPGHPQGGC